MFYQQESRKDLRMHDFNAHIKAYSQFSVCFRYSDVQPPRASSKSKNILALLAKSMLTT